MPRGVMPRRPGKTGRHEGARLTAIAIAATAHCEQIDKSGKPYILHPIRVLQRCSGESFETQIVAALPIAVTDAGYRHF